MRRIDRFLNLDELDEDSVEEDPTMTGSLPFLHFVSNHTTLRHILTLLSVKEAYRHAKTFILTACVTSWHPIIFRCCSKNRERHVRLGQTGTRGALRVNVYFSPCKHESRVCSHRTVAE